MGVLKEFKKSFFIFEKKVVLLHANVVNQRYNYNETYDTIHKEPIG